MPIYNDNQQMTLNANDLLNDIYIAYAWKKAQSYITSTNWYADNLEIKLSSIDFEGTVKQVKNKIKLKKGKFDLLHLIPVPKGAKWHFNTELGCTDWLPETITDQKLRPLAHISICDQTIMMLIMMGLANKVESIQGNPNIPFENVHEKKIVSYGNRLYCRYIDDKAFYNYSSSSTYSKYFLDYQNFLKRPQYFAKENIGKISPGEQIFILELDIEKFFDNVNRDLLSNYIEELSEIDERSKLNNILSKFKNWDWASGSLNKFEKLFNADIPYGIPQGLVAAGFLSNIYLINFDKIMLEKINKKFEETGAQLIDYCRYVDDIRIVVKADKELDKLNVLSDIEKYLNDHLDGIHLKINKKKSKIDSFIVSKGNISCKINGLKSKLSGPIPFEDLEDQLGQLEALLNLTRENDSDISLEDSRNLLQQIDKHYFDLREDSVKRFAANKITKILSETRHYTSQEVDSNGIIIPGEWDYVQERISRRFVALWCKDPSITLLLKKSIELFPDKKILKPILDELEKLRKHESAVLRAIADYCLSEIFRHSSTIIHHKNRLAFPAHADIQTFFELLQSYAANLIKEKTAKKEYCLLFKQAEYLLLVRLDTTLENNSNSCINDFIFKLCNGFRVISYKGLDSRKLALSILLANNIYKDESKFYRALSEFFENFSGSNEQLKQLIGFIVKENQTLFRDLYLYANNLNYKFIRCDEFSSTVDKYNFEVLPLSGSLESIKGYNSLLKLMIRSDNPFANEIMILKLFKAVIADQEIIRGLSKDKFFDFAKTQIKFDDFSTIPKYKVFDQNNELEVDLKFRIDTPNIIYGSLNEEMGTLHKVAIFIRSVIIGQEDWVFSKGLWVNRDPNRELKNSSISKYLSVWSSPEHLLGEGSQISNWLTDLLTKLLQINYYKPIKNTHNWPDQLRIFNLEKIIEDRLNVLRRYYCQLSEMPALIERVDLGWTKEKKNISVAMVQSKMPRLKDIKDYGLYLDDGLYRVQHRKHLTRVCKLILEHIKAQKVYEPLEKIDPSHNHIDILIWPELAVHKDDLDVLVNLSRKTKSIIYAGLCYIDQAGIEGPNNCAIWIVPNVHDTNQVEIKRLQGKKYMMALEKSIKSWRPYQLLLELVHPAFPDDPGFIISGSICYDATDIALSSDLRDKSNAYFISALNKDINTFDTMVDALHYHMFQHVVLVNSGEFGGSFAKAPYKDHYSRLISHVHGNDQVSISTFQMNMFDFRRDNIGNSMRSGKDLKSIPAGLIKH